MRTIYSQLPLSILTILVLVLGAACAGDGGSPGSAPGGGGGGGGGDVTRNPGTSKRPRGAFLLDAPVELSKGAWSGSLLTVNQAGHAMDGMVVRDLGGNIPAGTEITISAANITSNSFGSRFSKVLTPMITVEGTAQIRGPIQIRIPRPAGYNDDSDAVSVDPLESFLVYETVSSADADFIDVVLHKIKVAGSAPKRGDQGGIVLVESRTPTEPTNIPDGRAIVESASGFLPLNNAWPFVNWGSYAGPGGDCTGMSITAAYIYAATTGPTIRTDARFTEDTPGFTADDRDARRLCGKVQQDLGTAGALGLGAWFGDGLTTPVSPAKLIKTAKKRFADGVPCLLVLFSSTANGGHAVVAFAAGSNNLLIADPNFPDDIRHLTANADNSQWNPFSAQLNAAAAPGDYDIFYLVDPMKFADKLEPLYQAAIAGEVGADAFGGVNRYTLEDYCSKKITVRGNDNFVLENPDLKFFPTSEYRVGLQNQTTGQVEPLRYFFRTPGGTVEAATIKDNLQMINLERGVFDPEDEECDFCTNMIPHRTQKPIDTDVRVPIYRLVGTDYVWFDSINLKVKMKPMELDPAVAGGGLKP